MHQKKIQDNKCAVTNTTEEHNPSIQHYTFSVFVLSVALDVTEVSEDTVNNCGQQECQFLLLKKTVCKKKTHSIEKQRTRRCQLYCKMDGLLGHVFVIGIFKHTRSTDTHECQKLEWFGIFQQLCWWFFHVGTVHVGFL